MELKDKTWLKGELKKEFEQIVRTRFWADYQGRMDDERAIASRRCETDPAEKVVLYQGMVRAVDAIKGLPLEVLEVTPRKKS